MLAAEGGRYPPSLPWWKRGGAQKASHRRGEKLNTKERDKDGPSYKEINNKKYS